MIEEAKRQAALAAEARQQGLPEWQMEMMKTVPTSLIADVVRDNSSAVVSSPTPRPGVAAGPPARPLPLPPSSGTVPIGPRNANELALIDAIAEKFCGPPQGK